MDPSEANLPPILDQQNHQLLQPTREIDLGGVLLDDQLLGQTTMVEREVYLQLVLLARASHRAMAVMPPIRAWSKEISIDEQRVRKALHRLHDIGWITITNLKGPRDRFRILVKEAGKAIIDRTNLYELVMREARKIAAGVRSAQDDIIYIPPQPGKSDKNVFPEHISALIEQIPHVDKRGKRLSSYPHSVIHAKALHAPIDEIQNGLIELYSYEPSSKHQGKIGSIIATWSAMFTTDDKGRGILKTRPRREDIVPIKDPMMKWKEGEYRTAVMNLIDRKPIYTGHLTSAVLQRARRIDALRVSKENDKMEELAPGFFAELDEQGELQFRCYSAIDTAAEHR